MYDIRFDKIKLRVVSSCLPKPITVLSQYYVGHSLLIMLILFMEFVELIPAWKVLIELLLSRLTNIHFVKIGAVDNQCLIFTCIA